jgi:hypothetical protein
MLARTLLLLGSAWATFAVTSSLRRQPRAALRCPADNPDCHVGDAEISLEVERPNTLPEVAFRNEFVLQGTVKTRSPLIAATLLIQGKYPSSQPFRCIDLSSTGSIPNCSSILGKVIGSQGGTFSIVVRDQLFAEFVQARPFLNHLRIAVRNGAFEASLDREIFNFSFVQPGRPRPQ